MGKCKYCGEKAGFFKGTHKECKKKHLQGIVEIETTIVDAFQKSKSTDNLLEKAKRISKESYIDDDLLKKTLRSAWIKAVDIAFEDGLLSLDEEKRISNIIHVLGFTQEELNSDSAFQKLVQGAVLRDITEGKVPKRMHFPEDLPFNLMKSEKMVWVFNSVKYYEMRTYTKYVGGHSGVSVRIAKGLYYRAGAFNGNPVKEEQLAYVDTGLVGITTKHIYFAGPRKSLRVKYEKIVSFNPYKDGLGIQRDAQTAKPQIFVTGDGWFITNLVTNLAKM